MVDHRSNTVPTPTLLDRIWLRLVGRLAVLAVAAIMLMVFVARSGLGPGEAAFGWAVLAIAVMLLPSPTRLVPPSAVAVSAPALGAVTIDSFVNALIDPCLVLDRRSIVRYRNAAASRQFPNIMLGNPIAFALRNPELIQAIDSVWRNGQTRIIELHETLPTETWEKVAIAPLTAQGLAWPNDENPLLLVTFQSLTELKRVDAMRSDFIANASHELRTPLTSLLGFIDTLLGPAAKDTAAHGKFLIIMRNQAERMAKLIEDLLSLSRIEMHQHVRPTGVVDLPSLLREVREGLQTQAQAADVTINLDMLADAPKITGEREELYEVFENLVENAIKYGGSGKQVEIVLAASDQPGFSQRITITDHGPGVAPEHVPRLTERFYRVDAESSRKKKGTGLGLAITKHIVHRHRGQLAFRSRPGEGMRVDVYLPE